jgi:acetyl-CoA decarbonylase/synthase complex subunit delta
MAFEVPKIPYSGRIKEVVLGKGDKAVKVGEASAYPFYLFEGEMPNIPKIAWEVYDFPPEEGAWPETLLEYYKDVLDDPVAWAKKSIEEYKADIIALHLVSIDPNGLNRKAGEATEVVKKVADAIDVPMIVWGCGTVEKDEEVLRMVTEACEGKNLIIGPVVEGNYKKIGASAIGYQQTVIASTSIDINLAKQLNVLLGSLGVPEQKTVIDPTIGALGYGMEYSYSIIERIRVAALTQQDEKLQLPIICNIAPDVWKIKEISLTEKEEPKMGDEKKRGILIEAISAWVHILAGGDVIIMRHPEAIRLVKEMIGELTAP